MTFNLSARGKLLRDGNKSAVDMGLESIRLPYSFTSLEQSVLGCAGAEQVQALLKCYKET
jgi:hypothetical protein